ncbi:MAG: hypothetical protein ACLPWF_32680 [Bryobacteraceae bacterium]
MLDVNNNLHQLLYHSADYYSLEMLARELGQHYLSRWATHLHDTPNPSVERAARSIAAHLLDLGFDSDFLHQWWTYRITHEAGNKTLADLVDEAHAMSQEAPRRWEALVAFEALPIRGGVPNGWLDSPRVQAWLRANNFPLEGVRQNGGIELSVTARDPYAAVAVIRERLDAISARVALTLTGRLRVVNKVWIRGQDEPFDLYRLRHRAEIHSLRKEHQLYSVAEENSLLDSAIALMQPVNGGNLSAAISGAWGAVETLLFSPGDGDRVTAGDRMATIVACSFPRAELTAIAHNIDAATPLGTRVAGIEENKAKAREVALFIQNNPNDPITVTRTIDQASLARIKKIAALPSNGLRDVRGHLSAAFRRLYRSRNLILH